MQVTKLLTVIGKNARKERTLRSCETQVVIRPKSTQSLRSFNGVANQEETYHSNNTSQTESLRSESYNQCKTSSRKLCDEREFSTITPDVIL